MKPSIIEKLQQLSDRLEEVTHLLGQPEATSDILEHIYAYANEFGLQIYEGLPVANT